MMGIKIPLGLDRVHLIKTRTVIGWINLSPYSIRRKPNLTSEWLENVKIIKTKYKVFVKQNRAQWFPVMHKL